MGEIMHILFRYSRSQARTMEFYIVKKWKQRGVTIASAVQNITRIMTFLSDVPYLSGQFRLSRWCGMAGAVAVCCSKRISLD